MGELVCAVCEAKFLPPSNRRPEPSWPSNEAHPRYEDDLRMEADWDRYSRVAPNPAPGGWPGPLKLIWGTSTWRADGKPPVPDEVRPPRVIAAARRGAADDRLDAVVRAFVDGIEALVTAARGCEALAQLEGGGLPSPGKPKRATRRAKNDRARVLLLEHLGEVLGAPETEEAGAPAPRRPAQDETAAPAWHFSASLISLGVLAGLYEILTNAIKERGIEWQESSEKVAPRPARVEPFASVRHALRVAFGAEPAAALGGRAMRIGGAEAKHSLPQGMVFDEISMKPSRNGSEHAQGEVDVIEGIDVWTAIRAARVGKANPRPLDSTDLALLSLVELGVERDVAHRERDGTLTLAFEPLRIDEAVLDLRKVGVVLTPRQAKLRVIAARKAVEVQLLLRKYIPRPPPPKPPKERVSEGDRRRQVVEEEEDETE